MISVPCGTGDISSIWYPPSVGDICLRHMKERILYHIFTKWKYIIRCQPYITSRSDISFCKGSNSYAKQQKYLFCSPQTEKPTCFDKSVFQLNPPFRVGEILLRNVKYSLCSCEIAAAVGGFNFTFCFSKIFHQRRKPLISPWAFANDFT